MSSEERLLRAHDLGISALLGDTIYNFGELLLHPILEALRQPVEEIATQQRVNKNAWLRDLLFAFNRGDLAKFDRMFKLD